MTDIILSTLNARWSHASLGLRYLRANLGRLRARSEIREYTINDACIHIVEDLLEQQPQIIGFGVYIWNLRETEAVVATIKAIQPDCYIVIGGPEVSFGTEHTSLDHLADCIVSGEGDEAFANICEAVLGGATPPARMAPAKPSITNLTLPYTEYTDQDLAHRIIYVEASRGCPFTCEFCLSSIDEKVRAFDLDHFLGALDDLQQRGCRTFKFVDRTFNLKPRSCQKILDFFYDRWPRNDDGSLVEPASHRQMDGGNARNEAFFLHFEMVPDRLPESVKASIERFPHGAIQFEVGIQSFTPEVGKLISRRMDIEKTGDNLRYLRDGDLVHVHADLIVGLPGETPDSFATSYDKLFELGPDEIQVGILKLLKGTPIARHVEAFNMVFNPEPPYDLLANNHFPFTIIQRYKRFARYHELFVNSGRFEQSVAFLCQTQDSPCAALLAFSDWIWDTTKQEHKFALTRQYDLLLDYFMHIGISEDEAAHHLCSDHIAHGNKRGLPERLRPRVVSMLQQQRDPAVA